MILNYRDTADRRKMASEAIRRQLPSVLLLKVISNNGVELMNNRGRESEPAEGGGQQGQQAILPSVPVPGPGPVPG